MMTIVSRKMQTTLSILCNTQDEVSEARNLSIESFVNAAVEGGGERLTDYVWEEVSQITEEL